MKFLILTLMLFLFSCASSLEKNSDKDDSNIGQGYKYIGTFHH
jgi:hypothetical protein